MGTAKQAMKELKKAYGERSVLEGVTTYQAPRMPTGVFELDYMLGGGLPRGLMTEMYGPESSGKSNLATLAVAQAQKRFQNHTAVWIDAENTADEKWFRRLGVDTEKLAYARPSYGEQVTDAAEKFIRADDVSIVVIDSTAAIVGMAELEADVDKGTPGNATQMIQRMMKRITSAFIETRMAWEEEKRAAPPTLIMIN